MKGGGLQHIVLYDQEPQICIYRDSKKMLTNNDKWILYPDNLFTYQYEGMNQKYFSVKRGPYLITTSKCLLYQYQQKTKTKGKIL